MSPQSSANHQSNLPSTTISSLHALHKIESDSSNCCGASLVNPLRLGVDDDVGGGATSGASSSSPLERKRSRAHNAPSAASSKSQDQPFLSSYGSAFLSGIFADIAQVSDDGLPTTTTTSFCHGNANTAQDTDDDFVVSEPFHKRARTFTSFVGSPTHHGSTSSSSDDDDQCSPPPVVSPRPYASVFTLHRINDHVRELQDMAFPSFPQMPATVSAVSSCSSASLDMLMAEVVGDGDDEEGLSSYGWFVSTDEDSPSSCVSSTGSTSSFFMPDITKTSLAFKALAAPLQSGNQDVEVQQALAADTVDDVLGDLF